MPDYKQMYFELAGQVADAIEALDELSAFFKASQLKLEEEFVAIDDE